MIWIVSARVRLYTWTVQILHGDGYGKKGFDCCKRTLIFIRLVH